MREQKWITSWKEQKIVDVHFYTGIGVRGGGRQPLHRLENFQGKLCSRGKYILLKNPEL